MNYDKLLTPFKIGNMQVKNRIVMSPMGTNTSHPDGRTDNDEIYYFQERARGGAGMIITGAYSLTEELAQGSLEGYLDDKSVIPQLTNLCEAVQQYGSKICAQITCGTGKNAFANMLGQPPVSASAIPSMFDEDLTCRALTKEDIKEIIEQFEFSAKLAKDAGFDAIEVHGHAGYLIDQFMSAVWNKREDEYGGSLENRMRFPVEIVQSIRKAVGPDMPILFRIAVEHKFEGGRSLEEGLEMLKILEKAGVDGLDIDVGSYENIDYIFPPAYLGDACMEYICEESRKAVSIPILNSGNHTPETGLRLIESGDADFVMMGRPLIAEPYLVNKLMENKRDQIRPCIRCNEDCIGRIITRLTKISCSVNPHACYERRLILEETSKPKNVTVIGGGPGGMEAARSAAIKGHKVSLYEMSDDLRGQLKSAATPPFKSQLRELVIWYKNQMELYNIDINLNTKITADSSVLEDSDSVIVATGALPVNPPIPGIDNTIDVITAHTNPEKVDGQEVVFCGGGLSACDSALELAMEGKKVTIIEMLDQVAISDHFINKASLITMLHDHDVKLLTEHKVLEIQENGVKVEDKDNKEKFIQGDNIISAFGMRPNSDIANEIYKKHHKKTRIIGDSHRVGKVGTAIRTGLYAAIELD